MGNGKVFLIGAGCGDLDLITLKGYRILLLADVVIYDSLVAEDFLEILGENCEKICAGKRFSQKSMKQEDINKLLIEKAKEGKTVVRLKGGDPYVFGRGAEEASALISAGIDFDVIPGISSAFAVPSCAGISVTHRKKSRSVTVLTASSVNDDGKEELTKVDFESLIKLGGTIVILMGLHHLEEIVQKLISSGMNAKMPCAVISDGCSKFQKTVRGTLCDIFQKVKDEDLKAPAVIVVGECAQTDLTKSFKPKSLNGVTAGVCGTKSFFSHMSFELEKSGVQVCDLSFLKTVPLKEPLLDFKQYSRIVFTSPNGVKTFFEKMYEEKTDLRKIMHLKIASIGRGTSKKLEEYGFYPDFVPDIFDSVHLGKKLAKTTPKDEKILICRAENGSADLTKELEKARLAYTDFAVYKLVLNEAKKDKIFSLPLNLDYLIFGSAYGVKTFFDNLKNPLSPKIKIVCIGENCARALKEYNIINPIIAGEYSVDGIVECIKKDFERKG